MDDYSLLQQIAKKFGNVGGNDGGNGNGTKAFEILHKKYARLVKYKISGFLMTSSLLTMSHRRYG